MDYCTVLEAFDEDELVRKEPSSATHLLRNIDLDRNHIPLPSRNSGQAWRSRFHLDMILFLVYRKHLPCLTMKDELCPARTSSSNKVLVKTSNTPFTKEIENGVLLNVRYNRKVREIILNCLRVARGEK